MIKKLLLVLVFIAFVNFNGFGQTTLISATGDGGFENGATFGLNGWSATTGTATQNQWVCNTGATTGFSGVRAAYVTNNTAGTPPHTYTFTTTTYSHIFRPVTVPAGETDIQLNFDWVGIGEAGFFTNYDYLRVWKVPNNNFNLPVYGTAITANANRILLAEINDQATWTNINITLPTNLAGTTFRLVYEWTNDGSVGSNPPIAVDNISLISDLPPGAPINDEPCSAINLTVGPTCNFTTYTNAAATGTTGVPAPGCSIYSGGDVWFTVTVPASGNIVVDSDTGVILDSGMAIYSVTTPCPALTLGLVECDDDDSTNGAMSSITLTGRTPGEVLYIRFWEYGNNNNGTFDICITEPPPPPTNDEPCGSISIMVNSDFSCTNTTSGSINNSTNSGINPCAGTSDDDVWYHFVASGTSHTIDLLNITGSTTDLYHAVYGPFANANPPNCTNATVGASNISCSDPESSTLTGLVVGQTYFVQVYSWTSTSGMTSSFDICIGTPPPPPSNDEPCNAASITVNSTCIGTSGTVYNASDSGISSCFGTPDNDIWYSFVATNAMQTVSIFNVTGSSTDMYHAVYGPFTPPDCSVAVADNISCNDNDSTDLTGLTIGATYYVQVFTYWSGSATTSFDICVTEPCTNTDPINNVPTVCPLIAGELGVNPFVDPFDPDPSFNLDCSNPNMTLEAHSTIRTTDSYIVEQITYTNPNYTPTGFSTPQVINTDDVWAASVTPLPFNFCFYGTEYDEVLVGANGMITFDTVNNTPGSSCGWEFESNLPSTAGALFNETIYGVYHDIDPTGITNPTESWIEGTPGCRRFITAWRGVPMFSDATASREYTGMVVLHETTNIIEVFIENKRIENGNVNPWNDGNAIVGLQGNASAGEAITAPCRNGLDTNWETTNEAWRFVPNGSIIAPDLIEWFSASTGDTVIGTGATLPINAPDTYTAEVTYTTCGATVTLSDDVVVDLSAKTWNGSINTNWYVHDNWTPSGVPTLSDCVLVPDVALSNNRSPIADNTNIPGTIPIPPILASALNLTVDPNGYIEIRSGTNLQVMDWIHLDGTIDIKDSGSLIQVTEFGPNVNNNSGTGIINMQRTVPGGVNAYDYVYWSSPTEDDFNVTDISSVTGELIYEWNPTLNGITHGDWIPASGIMTKGKGYIVRGLGSTASVPANTAEFSGKPRNGVITVPITRGTYLAGPYPGPGDTMATALDDNWNLIGNPYPSAISYASFISANSHIDGTIYFWTHQNAPSYINSPFYYDFIYNYSDDYIDNNYTGSNPPSFNSDIAAGQAFFVLMRDQSQGTSASEDVIFNNTMRHETLDNSQFYRTNESSVTRPSDIERHRIWLDLINPNEIATSILIGYVEGATNENDRLYDGYEFAGSAISFYSLIGEEKMSIQGKALPFEDTDTVPLGIVIPENGNYTIAINSLDGLFDTEEQTIYLEDANTNIIHDLRVSPYSFNIEAGTFDDRFILRYNNESLDVDEFNQNSGLEILAPNNSYVKVISGNSPINSVIVYDLLGRVLFNKNNINNSEFRIDTLNLSEGGYIVKAILVNGKEKIQKVILKH